jgi:hypothetical protein
MFGIGIHILVALFFAVHVVRTGRELYWLLILFMFPLLGSIVYFLVVFLPEMQSHRGVRQAGAAVARSLDPGRTLREARAAFDLTPTAQNQMRLAAALLDAGQTADAVAHYDACLAGPFGTDAEINLGAARARLEHGDAAGAAQLLAGVRERTPGFRPEQVGLLLAKAHAAAGMHAQAGTEFAELAQRFASIEVRAEYALWALGQGQRAIAQEQLQELAHARRHMARHTKQLYADLFRRVDAASAGM